MNQLEKLQVLLPHWIEHNQGHADECRKWTDELGQDDAEAEVKAHLKAALEAMEIVSNSLGKALRAAGGPKLDGEHVHHHHH